MRFLTALAVFAYSLSPLGAQGEIDNPFLKTNVGDWNEYKMTGAMMSGKTRMTVVSKDDKELAYEIAGSFSMNGKEMIAPLQKQVIDLTKSYDPVVAANMKANGVKSEKLGEGTEKINVAGKDYETKWVKLRTTASVKDVTVVSEGKMWFCKDVPLSGLVKMEMSASGVATTLELVGSGSK